MTSEQQNEKIEIIDDLIDREEAITGNSSYNNDNVDDYIDESGCHEGKTPVKLLDGTVDMDDDDNDDNDDRNDDRKVMFDHEVDSRLKYPIASPKSSVDIVKSTFKKMQFTKDPSNTINSILDTLFTMFSTNEYEKEKSQMLLLAAEGLLKMHESNAKAVGSAVFTRVGMIAKTTRPEHIAGMISDWSALCVLYILY